jgi:hypothetical protein
MYRLNSRLAAAAHTTTGNSGPHLVFNASRAGV